MELIIVRIKTKDKELYKKKLQCVNPANMIRVDLNISEQTLKSGDNLEVSIDDS